LEILEKDGPEEATRVQILRDRLHRGLNEKLDGLHLNGHPDRRLPGTLNLSFDKVDSAAVLEMIASKGIAASSGSACSSGHEGPSHVLTAMGLPPERTRSALRFSLGYGNTKTEVDTAVEIISETVTNLRKISPL